MNLRNILSPGDFVIPVPEGALITLVYSNKGILETVYSGHQEADFRKPDTKLISAIHSGCWKIPLHIPFKDGTTRVRCVLKSKHDILESSFTSSYAYNDRMIELAIENPSAFECLALDTETFAAVLKGYGPVQQWMKISGFSTISGFLAPMDRSYSNFLKVWRQLASRDSSLQFAYPIEFVQYTAAGVQFKQLSCIKVMVNSCSRYLEDDGRVCVHLYSTPEVFSRVIDVSDQITHNIQKGSLVVFSGEEILRSVGDKAASKHPLERRITCTVCGNSYSVASSGPVHCPDDTCASNRLPYINSFLTKMKLPNVARKQFDEWIKKNPHLSVVDVFSYSPFDEIHMDCTLYDMMYALTPKLVCNDPSLIRQMVNNCNNKKETLLYHLRDIREVFADSNAQTHPCYRKLIEWMSIPSVVVDIQAMLNMPEIFNIVSTNIKYEGSPIFRGTTICITGKFLHGSKQDIEAILKGYSADVVSGFTPETSIVVVGGTHEEVDGMIIQHARSKNLSIYEENDFFRLFEIDKDMAENL